VDIRPGEGGVPDPARLGDAVRAARDAGRELRSVILTLPDNPTGTLASPATIRALCRAADEHDLIIISDEIYRDLVHEQTEPFTSPAAMAPGRTVVTTALSKGLALGGWRIGVARLPGGEQARSLRQRLRDRLVGIGSEIWSAPAAPIQQAAAYAFSEPPELAERITLSRRLHGQVARAVADKFAAAGADVPPPAGAFYLYPDFGPVRDRLRARHGIRTSEDLATVLLQRYGMGVLPGSAFGEDPGALRLRVATGLLYGETDRQRETALTAAEPTALPWIAAALDRIEDVLSNLTGRTG
jgi:aspartate aminotransferase